MDILILAAGLALIVIGAGWLTDGAAGIAKRFGVSEFMIGLTVMAVGTSMPEMVVSMVSGLGGHSDIAIGNVVGSNIFNTLVILGVTAMLTPIPLSRENVRRDIPLYIGASLVLLLLTSDLWGRGQQEIARPEGIVMILLFVGFIIYSVRTSSRNERAPGPPQEPAAGQTKDGGAAVSRFAELNHKPWFLALMTVLGLAALVYGGNIFLDSAVSLARTMGISEAVIGVTLLAGGTSLPELAASVTAALKKKPGIALGNVIGSNIANILLVLGASATVSPLTMGDIVTGDMLAVVGSSIVLLLAAFTFRKHLLDRMDGMVFILLYGAYIWWLLAR